MSGRSLAGRVAVLTCRALLVMGRVKSGGATPSGVVTSKGQRRVTVVSLVAVRGLREAVVTSSEVEKMATLSTTIAGRTCVTAISPIGVSSPCRSARTSQARITVYGRGAIGNGAAGTG